MQYSIGSFNLYKFSGESDEVISKNCDVIARIIEDEKFDVIALQELQASTDSNPKNVLINKRLLQKLNKSFDINSNYCIWDMVGSASDSSKYHSYSEGYAFVFNKRRLRLVSNTEAEIFSGYGMSQKLVRPPLYARFTPKGLLGGGFFELRLINTHLAFGRPDPVLYSSDLEYRRKELMTIATEIYPRIADKRYGDNMPSYTILMGDYNLCIIGDSKIVPYNKDIVYGKANTLISENRVLTTLQHEKSTLKQTGQPALRRSMDSDVEAYSADIYDGEIGGVYFSQDYDHFSVDSAILERLGVSVSRIDAVEKYYYGDLAKYRREVSDHVPIKMVISFRGRS